VAFQLRRSAAATCDDRQGGIVKPLLDGGARVPVGFLFWFAGMIETIGGALILIGLFTPRVCLRSRAPSQPRTSAGP
jgi:hypothetical protein